METYAASLYLSNVVLVHPILLLSAAALCLELDKSVI